MLSPSAFERQSSIIDALRFPLILLVVLIHSYIRSVTRTADAPLSSYLSFLLADTIALVAVPSFLIISAYFSFYKRKDYTRRDIYLAELKKRSSTLLFPIYYGIQFHI